MKKILAILLVMALAVMAMPGIVLAEDVPVEGYVCESTKGCSIDAPASIDFGKLEAGTCCLAPVGSDEITVTNTSKWEPAGKDCGTVPTVTVSFSVEDIAPVGGTLFHDYLSYACYPDCEYANLFSDDAPLEISTSVKYKFIGLNLKGVSSLTPAGIVYNGKLTITCE